MRLIKVYLNIDKKEDFNAWMVQFWPLVFRTCIAPRLVLHKSLPILEALNSWENGKGGYVTAAKNVISQKLF